MRKLSTIAKYTLAKLDSFNAVRRVDLALALTNFGLVAVVAQHFFEKLHDIARHVHHPLQTSIETSYSLVTKDVLIRIKVVRKVLKFIKPCSALALDHETGHLDHKIGNASK